MERTDEKMAIVQLQAISKIIASGNMNLIEDNLLTEEYFIGYEDIYQFITEHYKQYHQVPDKATLLGKFPDIELVEVTESDKYLVDTLREERLYYVAVPKLKEMAKLLKTNANAAVDFMKSAMKELEPEYRLEGEDIVANAQHRLEQFEDRKNNQDSWFFTTGFPELDDVIHGIQREEELILIFARTNMGKSFVLAKICEHIWEIGFNVGYVSPEMSANSIGYRFDTLYQHFSNKGLMYGADDIDETAYKTYLDDLKSHSNKFIVSTPNDFNKHITVSKLRNYVKQYKLDILAIDGITYLSDERFKKGDNKTTSLTNISEDLMSLSMELHIPILIVAQANRTGVVDKDKDGTPELESVRDSDGISHNASKVLSIRQKDSKLEIGIPKNRFGKVGGKLHYLWDIDKGLFTYIPSDEAPEEIRSRDTNVVDIQQHFKKDKSDIF